jgi:hypothetical protein
MPLPDPKVAVNLKGRKERLDEAIEMSEGEAKPKQALPNPKEVEEVKSPGLLKLKSPGLLKRITSMVTGSNPYLDR